MEQGQIKWKEVLERFADWFSELHPDHQCELIRHVVNHRPAHMKVRDVMEIPRGEQGFDLDIIDGVEAEVVIDDIRKSLIVGTVEVKNDYEVSTTGNIAVEFECNGRPSGISVTEADWIAYLLNGHLYRGEIAVFVRPERLLRITKLCPKTLGGDNKAAKIAITPITKLMMPLREEP